MMTLTDRNQSSTADGAGARMTQAWQWLCEQRAAAPEGAEVWDLRFRQDNDAAWLRELTSRVLRGGYRLSPMQLYGTGPDRRAVWGAQDALVLKWVALSLQPLLPLHPACEHVKGHGGGKPSVTTLSALLMQKKTDGRAYPWVCRTDIRGYYRNISKQTLSAQVRRHVTCPVLRDLVDQYLHYTVEDGGTFHTPDKGISRGCPLSPLMGALHLYDMDAHFAGQKTIHYARYMDDIIILAKSRWQLRKYTRQLKQWFSEYGFEAHPDKTFTGRTEKGFDWMGAWLTHEGVTDIAPRAKANHREKVRRLYERLARVPLWARKREAQRIHAKVSTYRKRWTIWAGALLAVSAHAANYNIRLADVSPDTPVLAPIGGGWLEIQGGDPSCCGDTSNGSKLGAIVADGGRYRVRAGFGVPSGGRWRRVGLYNGVAIISPSELEPCGVGLAIDAANSAFVFARHANNVVPPIYTTWRPTTGTVNPSKDLYAVADFTLSDWGWRYIPDLRYWKTPVALIKYTNAQAGTTCTLTNPLTIPVGAVTLWGAYTTIPNADPQLFVIDNNKTAYVTSPLHSLTLLPGTIHVTGAYGCSISAGNTPPPPFGAIHDNDAQRPAGAVVAAGEPITVSMTCTGGAGVVSAPLEISWSTRATNLDNVGATSTDDGLGVGLAKAALSSGDVVDPQVDFVSAPGGAGANVNVSTNSPVTIHPVLISTGTGRAAVPGQYTVTGTLSYVLW